MTLRVLLAEDEPPVRAKLRRLLGLDPRFAVVAEAHDRVDALQAIASHAPDLVFLGIQMPGLDGFELLDALGPERGFVVIFSTAHEQHALRAFDVYALDYLLKPYTAERFQAALERAARQLAGRGSAPARAPSSRIVVRTVEGWRALEPDSVLRVSAAGKHVVLYTAHGELRLRQSLAALAAQLDRARFVRVHRSEIVRVDSVVRYEPATHGDGVLTLSDGAAVILSRTQRREFLERFRGETRPPNL